MDEGRPAGLNLDGGSTGLPPASAQSAHVFSILDLLVVLVEVPDTLLKVSTLPHLCLENSSPIKASLSCV